MGNIIEPLQGEFSVCKVENYAFVNLNAEYCFIEKTNDENSLVCKTQDVPENTTAREDGWNGFRIHGTLDFALIGILAKIATLLANRGISIYAISTYNTDYVFVKSKCFPSALETLQEAGYSLK